MGVAASARLCSVCCEGSRMRVFIGEKKNGIRSPVVFPFFFGP